MKLSTATASYIAHMLQIPGDVARQCGMIAPPVPG
jgi:hypothetical protein